MFHWEPSTLCKVNIIDTSLGRTNELIVIPGVMRFLQTEWHRHERDRNAWEIERAEMKSRIARFEGEARTAKRLHESLGKHVKILEIALTREREKIKALSKGESVDLQRNPRDVAREELKGMGKGWSTSQTCFQLLADPSQKHI